MNRKHDFWYLLSGLGLGLGIGLLMAWALAPVKFIDTTPSSLRIDFKDDYRFMIASAYASNNDLLRAQARLSTLADTDPLKTIGEQAQRMMASNTPMEEVQILADLSAALQTQSTSVPSPASENTIIISVSPTNLTNTTPDKNLSTATETAQAYVVNAILSESPTSTTEKTTQEYASATSLVFPTPTTEETFTPQPKPIATIALRPTQTATPTAGIPFKLIKQSTFCEPTQPGLLQINLTNNTGKPAAGVELIITWLSGEEHFFTGLKPEIGFGYADFTMAQNIKYDISLSAGGTRITGLSAADCPNPKGSAYPGGIHLEFKQP